MTRNGTDPMPEVLGGLTEFKMPTTEDYKNLVTTELQTQIFEVRVKRKKKQQQITDAED